MNISSLSASRSHYEKSPLAGVYFQDDSLLNLTRKVGKSPSTSTSASTSISLQAAAAKKRKRNGGTGIYFEDKEVMITDKLANHPLQSSNYKSYTFEIVLDDDTPKPEGQPLFTPPALPATLQGQDSEIDDNGNDHADADDVVHLGDGRLGLPAPRPMEQHNLTPREPVKIEEDDSLFCERKRTAMRNRLHSRDYRLSNDELVFVEAAVKLARGTVPVAKKDDANRAPNQRSAAITKPKLPLLSTASVPIRNMPLKKRARSVSVDPYFV